MFPWKFVLLSVMLLACSPPSSKERKTGRQSVARAAASLEIPSEYQWDAPSNTWRSADSSGTRSWFQLIRRNAMSGQNAVESAVPRPLDAWENGCGPQARVTDVGCIADRRHESRMLDGRALVIETGQLKDMQSTIRTRLALRARWIRSPRETLVFDGAAADSAGLAQLYRIATSLRADSSERAP